MEHLYILTGRENVALTHTPVTHPYTHHTHPYTCVCVFLGYIVYIIYVYETFSLYVQFSAKRTLRQTP